jgi:hypothetical protein
MDKDLCNWNQGAVKVSLLTVGSQAMMDSYLCLIHLTAGIVVGKLKEVSSFNMDRKCVQCVCDGFILQIYHFLYIRGPISFDHLEITVAVA